MPRHRILRSLLFLSLLLLLATATALTASASASDPPASQPQPSEPQPSEPDFEWSLAPSSIVRGTETPLELSFSPALPAARASSEAPGIALVIDDTSEAGRILMRGVASDEAALRDVDLTLIYTSGDETILPAALRVLPGLPALLRLSPSELTRGQTQNLMVRGRNLDTITSWRFDPPLEIVDAQIESPTVAELSVLAGAGVEPGTRTLIAAAGAREASLPAALAVISDAPEALSVTPFTLPRGETRELSIEGRGLDLVEDVFISARIPVVEILSQQADRIELRVRVLDSARAGLTSLTLVVNGEALRFSDMLEIQPGELSLQTAAPEVLGRNADRSLFVTGRNLEEITSLDAGEGVSVIELDDTNPARLIARLRIAADAPIGFRTLRIDGAHGTATLVDAFRVGPEVLPQVRLAYPPEVSLADTQRGALRIASFPIENEGNATENIEVRLDTGDTNVFGIADRTNPMNTLGSLTVTLRPGERFDIPVRFAPIIQTSSAAAISIFVRDEELVGQMVLRARSTPQRLLYTADPLSGVGPLEPGTIEDLEPIRLLIDPIRGDESTIIEEASLFLARDGSWISTPSEAISWLLTPEGAESPRAWGDTGINWTWVGTQAGTYEGAFVLRTSEAQAPLMPLPIRFEAADDAPDTEAPTTPAPPSEETSTPTTDEATSPTPTPPESETPTEPSDEEEESGCGCNTRAAGGSAPTTPLLLMLALGLVRRRIGRVSATLP